MQDSESPFSAIVIRDGDWYVAFCLELPEGNGMGRTREEAIEGLVESLKLLFEDQRERSLAAAPVAAELTPLLLR